MKRRRQKATRYERMLFLGTIGVILFGFVFEVLNTESQVVVHVAEAHVEPEPKEVLVEVVYDWSQERIEQEIRTAADKYGVSYDRMYHTIECESGFDIDIQSQHILSYGQELSFGLSQIHLPDHPSVSYEDAVNPVFAIDFMAKAFSQGNAKWWTCYRMLYK